jgi:protocatechuate 3,4-dioxygenase beta subunit
VTTDDGSYRFRTIRPVPYPGRTPHIHFAIMAPGRPRLVTQMYVAGEPGNARDGVYLAIRDPAARARVTVALDPAQEPDALAGRFDIVLED